MSLQLMKFLELQKQVQNLEQLPLTLKPNLLFKLEDAFGGDAAYSFQHVPGKLTVQVHTHYKAVIAVFDSVEVLKALNIKTLHLKPNNEFVLTWES